MALLDALGTYVTLLDAFWKYISSGQVFGLPTMAFMAIPFVVGLVLGFMLKKILKIAIVLTVVFALAAYLGLVTVSLDELKTAFDTYGPQAAMYVAMALAILPLSTGLILGVIVALILG